jgi:hypothetical protein
LHCPVNNLLSLLVDYAMSPCPAGRWFRAGIVNGNPPDDNGLEKIAVDYAPLNSIDFSPSVIII